MRALALSNTDAPFVMPNMRLRIVTDLCLLVTVKGMLILTIWDNFPINSQGAAVAIILIAGDNSHNRT